MSKPHRAAQAPVRRTTRDADGMLATWVLAQLLTPQPHPMAMAFLADRLASWHLNEQSLEQALGLPTISQRRRMRRDYAAAEALSIVAGDSLHARVVNLRGVLSVMATQGTWYRWRSLGAAPDWADDLQRHAFTVLSCGPQPDRPHVPSVRTLKRLVGLGP